MGRPLCLHLVWAFVSLGVCLTLAYRIQRDHAERAWIARPALGLAALALFQASLGAASWISKSVSHTVLHVATGAALLGLACSLALRVRRCQV